MLDDGRASAAAAVSRPSTRTSVGILVAISASHLVNDMLQSLLPAVYPMLKQTFHLDFWEVGLITLSNQLTASLLQPFVGLYTDRRPQPYSLAVGMTVTVGGLVLLSTATRLPTLLAAAALVGVGSSVFHPESSRVARAASGGQHGLAQSLFQTGGNAGSSLGPLLAAFIVLPRGQGSLAWFALAGIAGIGLLSIVGHWYATTGVAIAATAHGARRGAPLEQAAVRRALAILVVLVFSKFVYLTSISSYYTFFLIHRFGVSVRSSQLHLFLFLAAVAAGTFAGGPIGDRLGRKFVIWVSILGVLPFTLALPYANLTWTTILSVVIGLVMSSAFSAILVYAQDLVPGRVGLVAGLFFGLAFGIGGLGAAALGRLADFTGIETVYRICSILPALGLLTAWLPNIRPVRHEEPDDVAQL
jgi:FSR family fosmidomycin resistance protein-like MFS transporter